MWRFAKKRIAIAVSGVFMWIRSLRDLYSIPGYIDDGQEWSAIWQSIGITMTPLDWILLVAGGSCLAYAFEVHTWPRRLRSRLSHLSTGLMATLPSVSAQRTCSKTAPHPRTETPIPALPQIEPDLSPQRLDQEDTASRPETDAWAPLVRFLTRLHLPSPPSYPTRSAGAARWRPCICWRTHR